MEFTFTTPATLVSETATVSITTSWTDMGGVAHNSQTNTATVTVTAAPGVSSSSSTLTTRRLAPTRGFRSP